MFDTLDIYGAQKHIEKLLNYVQGLRDSQPNMYGKSKDRLKYIANMCIEIVEDISYLIEDESLSADDILEFGSSKNDIIDEALDSMQDQLNQLRQFVNGNPQTLNKDSSVNEEPKTNKRTVIRDYKTTLSRLATADTGFEYANRCSQLLWRWFDSRFLHNSKESNFRYNMRRFPNWICDIVVLYSKSIRDGTLTTFENDFNDWIGSISTSDATSKFAIPYEVYRFDKSPELSDVSLDAAVMWDILLHNGLSDLCKPNSVYYISSDLVYSKCEDVNIQCLDDYEDYIKYPDVLDKLSWTKRR